MSEPGGSTGTWTLLTGHGHVLVEIARNPEARIRDISAAAGLTERTVQAIVADLEAAGYLTRSRTGRRTLYTVNPDSLFRHSAQEGLRVGPFLDLLATDEDHPAAPGPAQGPGLGDPALPSLSPASGDGDAGHRAVSAASGDADHDQASIVGGIGDGAGEDAVGLGGGGQPPVPPGV
jgi:MarR family protein